MAEPFDRRNRNFRVTVGDAGIFVKQPDRTVATGASTLQAEAAFYHVAGDAGLGPDLGLVGLVHYDPDRLVLVLELLDEHRTLTDHLRERSGPAFDLRLWREVGHRLGDAHRVLRELPAHSAPAARPPWVADAWRPRLHSLATLSPAGAYVLEALQTSTVIRDGLEDVRRSWGPRQLIHGDVRGSNVLVGTTDEDGRPDVRFIDWELVRWGDPLWDLAGALDLLLVDDTGPLSRPVLDDGGESSGAAAVPWPVFQAASRTLWDAWVATSAAVVDDAVMRRLATYCAARVVETVIEATGRASVVPDDLITALQVAENIFDNADTAMAHFFAVAP